MMMAFLSGMPSFFRAFFRHFKIQIAAYTSKYTIYPGQNGDHIETWRGLFQEDKHPIRNKKYPNFVTA